MRSQTVGVQIAGHIHEHLVDGVDDDVLGRDVFHIDGVNAVAVLHVIRHARRCDDEIHGEGGAALQFGEGERRAGELMPRSIVAAADIRFPDALAHLEQPSAAGNAVAFERRRDGETDGLVRAGLVRDNKVRVERIEVTLPALHGGIKGFQVDSKIGAVLHGYAPFRRYSFSGYHQPEWQI